MEYKKLKTTSEDPKFENTRFHIINYILRQGELVIRNHTGQGRLRPPCNKEEYGTVISENFFYSFHIEPLVKGKIRELEIVVGTDNPDKLQREVSRLKDNNQLR